MPETRSSSRTSCSRSPAISRSRGARAPPRWRCDAPPGARRAPPRGSISALLLAADLGAARERLARRRAAAPAPASATEPRAAAACRPAARAWRAAARRRPGPPRGPRPPRPPRSRFPFPFPLPRPVRLAPPDVSPLVPRWQAADRAVTPARAEEKQEGRPWPPVRWRLACAVGSVCPGPPAWDSSVRARRRCRWSPSRLKLLDSAVKKVMICWSFRAVFGPVCRLRRIVVPRDALAQTGASATAGVSPAARRRRPRGGAARRTRARGRSPCARARRARGRARAASAAARGKRRREQLERGVELPRVVLLADRRGDDARGRRRARAACARSARRPRRRARRRSSAKRCA